MKPSTKTPPKSPRTNIIGLKELRENMEKYISEVEKGRSFVVVKKSKPAFKMVPADEWGDEGVWKTLIDFSDLPGGGLSAEAFTKILRGEHGSGK